MGAWKFGGLEVWLWHSVLLVLFVLLQTPHHKVQIQLSKISA